MKKSQKQICNGKELESFALKSRVRQGCILPLLISILFWCFWSVHKMKNRKEKVYLFEKEEEKDIVNL